MSRPVAGKPRPGRIAMLVALACALVAVPAVVVLFSVAARSASPWFGQYSSDAGPAYDFSLTDQDGRPLRLRDLAGNVVLLSFGFTRCPNICPTTLGNLAAVVRTLPPALRDKVKVVFVSVDERDTPATMKDYVPFFDSSFIGLVGSPADIGTAARAYGAFFRKAPPVEGDGGDYMIDHSTYTYLVDPAGKLRIHYRFDQMPETARIVGDVTRVLGMPGPP